MVTLMLSGFGLLACGGAPSPTPDRVATRVAEDKAVAATLTADAALTSVATLTPVPPATVATNTPPPAPTPTPIVIERLPVDGEDGNLTLRGSWRLKKVAMCCCPASSAPK